MFHRFAVRKVGTSLLMQQAFKTGKLLGWTSDIYGCRLYLSKGNAIQQASLAGFAAPEVEIVTLPMPDRERVAALTAALEAIVAKGGLPPELLNPANEALDAGKVLVA